MQRAVQEARKTVRKFIAALKHPGAGEQDFEIKKPFVQGDQVEHIWLSDVRLVGNRFFQSFNRSASSGGTTKSVFVAFQNGVSCRVAAA